MKEQRRAKRFNLALPLKLFRRPSGAVSVPCETRNLSSRGVLFTSEADIGVGEAIQYVITLPTANGADATVELHCLGKVLRSEKPADAGEQPVQIAATLERYEFVRAED